MKVVPLICMKFLSCGLSSLCCHSAELRVIRTH